MKITMDMSSYEIEQDEIKSVEYGAENMNNVWDPADDPVCGLQEVEFTTEVKPAVVSANVLSRIYACRQ